MPEAHKGGGDGRLARVVADCVKGAQVAQGARAGPRISMRGSASSAPLQATARSVPNGVTLALCRPPIS
eukprot:2329358-Lingulodinium_polyedra.AAC.1